VVEADADAADEADEPDETAEERAEMAEVAGTAAEETAEEVAALVMEGRVSEQKVLKPGGRGEERKKRNGSVVFSDPWTTVQGEVVEDRKVERRAVRRVWRDEEREAEEIQTYRRIAHHQSLRTPTHSSTSAPAGPLHTHRSQPPSGRCCSPHTTVGRKSVNSTRLRRGDWSENARRDCPPMLCMPR
jgi:hypothetical protein